MKTCEEQIAEMAKDLKQAKDLAMGTVGSLNNGFGGWYGAYMYNQGYRKQSEVVKGIRDKIETQGRFEFCGADGKEYLTIRTDRFNEIIKAAEYGVEVDE